MAAEGRKSISLWWFCITVFTCLMLAQKSTGQGTQSLYSCWGGCYNVCFLLNSRALGERYPCYLSCLASCFPQSVAENENQLYYCHVGCSTQRCLVLKKDSARKKCIRSCGDVCKT